MMDAAPARDDAAHRVAAVVSVDTCIFFLSSLRSSSSSAVGREEHRAVDNPPIHPAVVVTPRSIARSIDRSVAMLVTMRSSPRAPPPRSVTSDDSDDNISEVDVSGDVPAGAKRRHSFSTDCSARTAIGIVAVPKGRADADGADDDDGMIAVVRDRASEETCPDADGAQKISMTALRALAETRADVARPDGADLHADVCATLLRREGAIGRDALMTTTTTHAAGEMGATWHHAPYRGQLVEWILDVCAGERYGPTTADVAIAYTVRA